MRHAFLLAICATVLLAGSASAQQPGYDARSAYTIVDMGGGYRVVATSPYYTPGSSVPSYYSVGYSPAYQRYLTFPNYGPYTMPASPNVYYVPAYGVYYRSLR
jgi:hypothetical protein